MLTTRTPAGTLANMRGSAVAFAICAAAWSVPAHAADPQGAGAPPTAPGADQIQFAAHEHDLGYRAYVDKHYDEAATHFENAFFAAPNQAELRSAIRSRRDAGQLARAATLAAIGLRKFPGDAVTAKLAEEVIAQARPEAYEVHVVSSAECSVVIDEKIVVADRVKDFRVFVSPGRHDLLVSWSEDRSQRVPIDGAAGGSQTLTLDPPVAAPPAPPSPEPAPTPVLAPGPEQAAPPSSTPAASRPLGPAVFITGAVLTAALAGVTVWSRVDAANNPGPDTVRRVCVGQGESCPTFQEGVNADRRTFVLLGATGGVALATAAVGVFFTRWSHGDQAAPRGASVAPALGFGHVAVQGTF